MAHSVHRLVILVLVGLLIAFTHADTVPDHQDTASGEPPGDATTKSPIQQVTEQPFTFDYEDTTYSQDMEEEGVGLLGPGAITAIVIAVFLGASVLLALIVITLRKFTTS